MCTKGLSLRAFLPYKYIKRRKEIQSMSSLAINAVNYNQPYIMSNVTVKSRSYPKWAYEKAGFTCRCHLIRRNELYFNNVKYNREEANSLMERMGWEIRASRLHGKNGLIIHVTDVFHNGRLVSR